MTTGMGRAPTSARYSMPGQAVASPVGARPSD